MKTFFLIFLATLLIGGANFDAVAAPNPTIVKINSCYSLADQTSTQQNPCPADLYTMQGQNVDMSSASSFAAICLLGGVFQNIDQVPSDYSKCSWSSYLEGMEGLAGRALILRDRSTQHHYKWFVQSNTLPVIIFNQATID